MVRHTQQQTKTYLFQSDSRLWGAGWVQDSSHEPLLSPTVECDSIHPLYLLHQSKSTHLIYWKLLHPSWTGNYFLLLNAHLNINQTLWNCRQSVIRLINYYQSVINLGQKVCCVMIYEMCELLGAQLIYHTWQLGRLNCKAITRMIRSSSCFSWFSVKPLLLCPRSKWVSLHNVFCF